MNHDDRHVPRSRYWKDKEEYDESWQKYENFMDKIFIKHFPTFFKIFAALVCVVVLGAIIGIIIVVSAFLF